MKKHKNLIIALIAVIAVGALVCVGLTLMKDGSGGSERRFISGFGADEITGISVTGEAEFFFVKTAEGWGSADDSAFPADSGKISSLAAEIASRTVDKIADRGDSGEYGLNTPRLTLRIFSGKDETVCTVGDYNDITDVYYVKIQGLKGIYSVAAGFIDGLLEGENRYVLLPDMSISGEITSVSAARGGETLTLEAFTPDAPQTWRTDCSWVIANDYGALAVDGDAGQRIIAAASSIRPESCYDYAPTPETAEACGFGKKTTVTITTGEETLAVELGGQDDEGRRFIRLAGDGMICLVSGESARSLDFSLAEVAVMNPLVGVDEDTVESVTIHDDTGTYTLSMDEANRGKIEAVLALSSDAYSSESENYKFPAQIFITVRRSTGEFSTLELELVRFNDLLWVARTWGIGGCFVTDGDVQEMLAEIK